MRVLLLVALIGVASTVFVQKLTWRESLRSKMMKDGTWAEYRKQRDELVARSRARDGGGADQLKDYNDNEYLASITIGTPEQEFWIVMDTGSPDLFVSSKACTNKKCQEKHQFDPSKSSTYQSIDESFHFQYGSGECWGHYANETVSIGETGEDLLVLPNTVLGLAERLNPGFLRYPEMDGIFGLSYRFSDSQHDPVLIDAMKRGLFKNPIFTIFYERRGTQDNVSGGQITFGGLDEKNCGPVIAYQPLSKAWYFEFEVDQLKTGDLQINRTIRTIVDSGTSTLIATQEIIDPIISALKAETDYYGYNWVDCDQQVSVDITIGGRVYSINSTNLIQDVKQNGKCLLAIEASSGLGVDGMPEMILGDPFHRQYCVVYDLQQQRVGFANPLHN